LFIMEKKAMSISAVGSVALATATGTSGGSRSTGFDAPMLAAVGRPPAQHEQRSQSLATGSGAAEQSPGLAADTRSLFGDVFGALGASAPSPATAQRAVAAYSRAR